MHSFSLTDHIYSICRHFFFFFFLDQKNFMADKTLKACLIFFFFFFHQMMAAQKLWKIFLLRMFKIFGFPSSPLFFFVDNSFRGWSKINLKVYEAINGLNKNLRTHFVYYLEKEMYWNSVNWYSIKWETFLWKHHAENVHQKLFLNLFLILVNNPKRPLHTRNSFKNKIFCKRIIKKPEKFFFLSNPIPFNSKYYEKQKGPGNIN